MSISIKKNELLMQKRIDYTIFIIVIILSTIGLLMIYSTSDQDILIKQLIWLVISAIIALLFVRPQPRMWSSVAWILYLVTIVMLIAVFFVPGYPKNRFHISDITLQPSEFAKLTVIIFAAMVLSSRKKLSKIQDIIVPLLIFLIPAILIFIEPDFGSSQIFIPIMIMMLYWAGMPFIKIFIFLSPILAAALSFNIYVWVIYFAGLILLLYWQRQLFDLIYGVSSNFLIGLSTPFIWNALKSYQRDRIISFFSPWVDPKGMSWQIIQSKIAIGSGGLIGKGFLSGTQKKLEFLPERHTDFIFSCLGEEFGLIGILIVTVLIFLLLYRLLLLARESKNRFASLVAAGVFAWVGYQSFLNIGMTMGLLPITGVTLPFISYGGSSMLALYAAIGICLAISRTRFEY
ncbi:rod shape-determining protein RodA [candidate division WOR-3 bacterium RBG_13_43_14]|uniref:Rod shape-determining protein RodA n=1 Tax=candidate division WOR-3 bacterium RBG_13_43_14 TaxID=1802590 RepID=A0A1F4U8V4_UNCW3|nr:MAG: rod shape-determining protein RodA [candidate division WOR-3 bacterium RBG_13_43_14]